MRHNEVHLNTRMGTKMGSCSEARGSLNDLCTAPTRDATSMPVSLLRSPRDSRSFSQNWRHSRRRLGELERPVLKQVQQLERCAAVTGGSAACEPVSEAETSTGGSREMRNRVRDPERGLPGAGLTAFA